MKRPQIFSGFKNISLTKKLYFVVGIMTLLITIELFTFSIIMHTLSATRALVGAEGLWSKSQKDALYLLTEYGHTHDENDYVQYQKLLAIPFGDRKARLELMKPNPNLDTVRKGFMEASINPNDIDRIINLLTRFHRISYIQNAVSIWTEGDYNLDILINLGKKLHTEVSSGKASIAEITNTQNAILKQNKILTTLENKFSSTLGDGSRWIEHLVLKLLFLIVFTVASISLSLTISVTKAITKSINEIMRIARSIAKADFTERAKVYSTDEIGLLAISFNQMADDLHAKIEEEKKITEALITQKNLYEVLYKTENEMGLGVSVMEGEKIIYVNDAFCNIHGYSREEILQLPSFLSLLPDEDKPELLERLKKRINGERRQNHAEARIVRKDGKMVNVEYTVQNIEVEGRHQMRVITRDITEKKQYEEQLRIEKEHTESAEIAKKIGERFLTNMSHEIRTPMNAIVGFTHLMLKTSLTLEQHQYIDAIKISGDNLLVIINDILDLSRIKAGKMPIEQSAFKLSGVVAMSTELMRTKAMEKGIKISAYIDEHIDDDLIGDATRLNQVLLNLISNAIKFTERGEITIQVNLLSNKEEEVEVEIIVKDTGIGIPKDKIDTIFHAFMQADNDTARKYGGTGLGLAIVKQLAELQGGSISVSSEEGKGSSFFFRIKYKKDLNRSIKNDSPLPEEVPKNKIKNLNILLVEDNEMNQLFTKTLLENWGWHIDIAEDGIEAVKKAKNKDFDVILMDVQMPKMDGYVATRLIRNSLPGSKCNIPILAMTAHALRTEEEKCYKAGMNDYISKPFDPQNLYVKIESILNINKPPTLKAS